MADKEKIPEFRKTVDLERVIEKINSYQYYPRDLVSLFDEYPIFAVRKAILERWLDHPVEVLDWQVDWIEARICDLKTEEGEMHPNFWKELISWYIFGTKGKLANRAFDFAVGIAKKSYLYLYRSDILKIIAGKLDRSPEIYQDIETPSLRLFLESFLVQAYQPNFTIYDSTMVDIKRVVRCAVKVGDWRFLPLVEQVLYKLSNQRRPERYDFREEVEFKENLAFLKEAARLLREKTEETKNM